MGPSLGLEKGQGSVPETGLQMALVKDQEMVRL